MPGILSGIFCMAAKCPVKMSAAGHMPGIFQKRRDGMPAFVQLCRANARHVLWRRDNKSTPQQHDIRAGHMWGGGLLRAPWGQAGSAGVGTARKSDPHTHSHNVIRAQPSPKTHKSVQPSQKTLPTWVERESEILRDTQR
jgi:hypothetical protein